MKDFMDLVRQRRSVRAYTAQPVEREKLEELAEALRLAPSASNQQPWRLVFIDDPAMKDAAARATFGKLVNFNRFAPEAPVVAVIVIEPPRLLNKIGAVLQSRQYPLIDVGIAAAQLCLRAAELGLGTCMLGWFDEKRIKKIIAAPAGRHIGLVITIGYPANGASPGPKARKSLDAVRAYNKY
jgi:nitroreductase